MPGGKNPAQPNSEGLDPNKALRTGVIGKAIKGGATETKGTFKEPGTQDFLKR